MLECKHPVNKEEDKLVNMKEHKVGVLAVHDEVCALIIAALQMHGKKSINKLSRLTGFHFDTVKARMPELVAEGKVEKIHKEEYEYQIPEEDGEKSA